VRAATEVDELTLLVERDPVVGEALDDLDLVVLPHGTEAPDRLGPRHFFPCHGEVLAHDRAHGLLDTREVLGREALRTAEVVVEAVLDDRADRDLDLREEPLHGLGHEMRRRVSQDGESLGDSGATGASRQSAKSGRARSMTAGSLPSVRAAMAV